VVREGKAERRAVTLGAERDAAVVIEAGLKPNEDVVAVPVAGLADGAAVRRKAAT
jgi:hypothetical protein